MSHKLNEQTVSANSWPWGNQTRHWGNEGDSVVVNYLSEIEFSSLETFRINLITHLWQAERAANRTCHNLPNKEPVAPELLNSKLSVSISSWSYLTSAYTSSPTIMSTFYECLKDHAWRQTCPQRIFQYCKRAIKDDHFSNWNCPNAVHVFSQIMTP